MPHALHDAIRFWKASPGRGLLLLASCALIVALAAVNTVVLRSSLWFTPPGVDPGMHFLTLGQHTPEGRFEPVALQDLDRLRSLVAPGGFAAYGRSDGEVRLGDAAWPAQPVALVSDRFFEVLGVDAMIGETPGADAHGAMLSHAFWSGPLHSDPSIVGKSINIAGADIRVVGIAPPAFKGLGDLAPVAWIPDKYTPAFFDLLLPLPQEIVDSAKAEFATLAPFFFGIVDAGKVDPDDPRLTRWKVRDTREISLSTPTGPLKLGFDATGHASAVYPRIDITPQRTATVARYLAILGLLNAALAFLALLNLASFWSARTSERAQELQCMVAVGARRRDLAGMFLSEALPFLALVLLLSVPLAYGQFHLVRQLQPMQDYLQGRGVALSARDFLPGLGLIVAVGVVAVAWPWRYLRESVLRSRSIGATAATERGRKLAHALQWALSAFVAGAVGLSLLVALRLNAAPWGGSADPVLVTAPEHGLEAASDLARRLGLDEDAMAVIRTPPLTRLPVRAELHANEAGDSVRHTIYFNAASPQAFDLLGVPLLAGRTYAPHSENEVVLSASAAALFGGPAVVVGRHLTRADPFDASQDTSVLVTGVVGDIHYDSVRTPAEAVAYVPPESSLSGMTVLLPHRFLASGALDHARSMSDKRADQVRTELLLAGFTFCYAVLALGLMGLGLLSLARTRLQQHGRELGLRAALGASLGQAAREFMRAPALVAVAAALPVVLLFVLALAANAVPMPLAQPLDAAWVGLGMAAVLLLFGVTLFGFARRKLARFNLSELLRAER